MPLETCASCHLQMFPIVTEYCHICKTPICKDCLEENAAYTYPDNQPYCPSHQSNNEEPDPEPENVYLNIHPQD